MPPLENPRQARPSIGRVGEPIRSRSDMTLSEYMNVGLDELEEKLVLFKARRYLDFFKGDPRYTASASATKHAKHATLDEFLISACIVCSSGGPAVAGRFLDDLLVHSSPNMKASALGSAQYWCERAKYYLKENNSYGIIDCIKSAKDNAARPAKLIEDLADSYIDMFKEKDTPQKNELPSPGVGQPFNRVTPMLTRVIDDFKSQEDNEGENHDADLLKSVQDKFQQLSMDLDSELDKFKAADHKMMSFSEERVFENEAGSSNLVESFRRLHLVGEGKHDESKCKADRLEGSVIKMEHVKVSEKKAMEFGSPIAVSKVRRSARFLHNSQHEPELRELLEQSSFSYMHNSALESKKADVQHNFARSELSVAEKEIKDTKEDDLMPPPQCITPRRCHSGDRTRDNNSVNEEVNVTPQQSSQKTLRRSTRMSSAHKERQDTESQLTPRRSQRIASKQH